jgi:branched-chain amino acid transport system substrate-binding protein
VGLIHENTDFGTAAALAQKKALRDHGMVLAAEVSYVAEGVKDLTREVEQVLASRPDAVIETTYLHDSILIRKAMLKAGSRIPLVDTAGGSVSPEYVRELGDLAEGTLTSSEFSRFTAEGRELSRRFRERFGFDVTGDSAYAYQAVWVLKDALERAASTDRNRLREALAGTSLPKGPNMILPSERIRFDASGQNESARLFIVQVQKGELVPVWPREYATAEVELRK